MNLNETLTLMAAQLKADPAALMAYAAEDNLGGYHINEALRTFPMGSLWGVEGQILYALVRWLKPARVVEIGGWVGCSASHLALAVQANGTGEVISVDSGEGGMEAGSALIPTLRPYVTFIKSDGLVWLDGQPDESIGLVFEDADHSTELTANLSRRALDKLEAGGVLVNHDAAHDFAFIGGGQRVGSDVGRAVRAGLEQAGLYFRPYLAEPSDCGVAVTVKPGVRSLDVHSQKIETDDSPVYGPLPQPIGNANIESLSPPPEVDEKPKAKPRKRK